MRPFHRRLLGLCAPPILLATLDGVLTLGGQSADYWAGNYSNVEEISPSYHRWLAYHPVAFIGGFAGWALVFSSLILLLPQTLALITSITVTVGHTWGATTWIAYKFPHGYQICNGLFLLTGIALAVGIQSGWHSKPQNDEPVGATLPSILRWFVIAGMLGFAGYLFVFPQTA